MPLHKINNTPHLIDILVKYTSTQVMSVCIAYPLCNEIFQIYALYV